MMQFMAKESNYKQLLLKLTAPRQYEPCATGIFIWTGKGTELEYNRC